MTITNRILSTSTTPTGSADIMAAGAGREAYNLSVGQATERKALNHIQHETATLNNQLRPAIVRSAAAPPNPTPMPAADPGEH